MQDIAIGSFHCLLPTSRDISRRIGIDEPDRGIAFEVSVRRNQNIEQVAQT